MKAVIAVGRPHARREYSAGTVLPREAVTVSDPASTSTTRASPPIGAAVDWSSIKTLAARISSI